MTEADAKHLTILVSYFHHVEIKLIVFYRRMASQLP
jgi:hypothetical protein